VKGFPVKLTERRIVMGNMERLLDALADCGEAAIFYKGKDIIMANRLFAELFEMEQEECGGLPIIDILHEESIEMIRDFIRRRAMGDTGVPEVYTADFRTKSEPRVPLHLIVVKTSNTGGALLVILKKTS
jgi:PAS domain S-box-containing protein